MEYNASINPIIGDPAHDITIQFRQTRETLLDTEEYMRFIYSVENQFRRSRFYKDYKSNVMGRGLNFDQQMRAINGDMADMELHHHLPTLKDATITITEKHIITEGSVCTFDVINDLIEAHRKNIMGIVMMTTTNHQLYEVGGGFISLNACYGNPFEFISEYGKYTTLDIAFRWLLMFKQNEQYGGQNFWPMIARAREQLMDWSSKGYIRY